jgi:medium-chain acyl-[acyl-carrier-protein] hydrolase
MGALVSFELARRLRQTPHISPARLFVSGCRAPQFPVRDEQIHDLPEREFIAELRALNGTPEAAFQDDQLMRLMLPMLRADFSVCETYAYAADQPLDCPISAFGGIQDERISQLHVASWREHTSGPFRLRMLPGDHFFVHSARTMVVQAVLQDLAPLLRPIQGRYV